MPALRRSLPAAGVALMGGVFAFGLIHQHQVSQSNPPVVVPAPGFRTFPAAPIKGRTLNGGAFSLASLRGEIAFVNFWETSCAPCEREAPQLRAFARSLPRRVAMVGVVMDSPSSAARRFAAKSGWRYPVVRESCCDLTGRYGVVGYPTTIVINARGQVVDRLLGAQTATGLRAELKALDRSAMPSRSAPHTA